MSPLIPFGVRPVFSSGQTYTAMVHLLINISFAVAMGKTSGCVHWRYDERLEEVFPKWILPNLLSTNFLIRQRSFKGRWLKNDNNRNHFFPVAKLFLLLERHPFTSLCSETSYVIIRQISPLPKQDRKQWACRRISAIKCSLTNLVISLLDGLGIEQHGFMFALTASPVFQEYVSACDICIYETQY